MRLARGRAVSVDDQGNKLMAQSVVTWLIGDGRFRVHAINALGRHKARIIEVEEVATGERFHGSARRLERLERTLRISYGDTNLERTRGRFTTGF